MLRGNNINSDTKTSISELSSGNTILEQMQNNNNNNKKPKKQAAPVLTRSSGSVVSQESEANTQDKNVEDLCSLSLVPPSISPMSLDSRSALEMPDPGMSSSSSSSPVLSSSLTSPASSPLFSDSSVLSPTRRSHSPDPTTAPTSPPASSMFSLLTAFLPSGTSFAEQARNEPIEFPPDATLLLSARDVAELNDFLKQYPDMRCVFKSPEDILHALRVIKSLKPQQRLSTIRGMYLQSDHKPASPWHVPLFVVRWWTNEDRQQNLQAVKCVFFGALWMMDDALKQCSVANPLLASSDDLLHPQVGVSENMPPQVQLQLVRFRQLFERLREAIVEALSGLQNLKQTYCDDAHTCARIDTMAESVQDRLHLAAEGLKLLRFGNINVNINVASF